MTKIIVLTTLIILLSFTACIQKSQNTTTNITEKTIDNIKLELRNETLILKTIENGVQTYSIQIDGLTHSKRKGNVVLDNHLEFTTIKDGLISLHTSSRNEHFKSGEIIGSIQTTNKNLNSVKIIVKKVTEPKLSAKEELREKPRENGTILGDYNQDFVVDLKDFNVFVDNFGQDKPEYKLSPANEQNQDGLYYQKGVSDDIRVNDDDFTIFTNNFGFGEIFSLAEIGEYLLAGEIAERISSKKPNYPYSYLFMLMKEWYQFDGFKFLKGQDKYLSYLLGEIYSLDWNRSYELYDHLYNSIGTLERLYDITDQLVDLWPENEVKEVHFPYIEDKILFDELTIRWLYANVNLFRIYASFVTAYDLHGDFHEFINGFSLDANNKNPLVDGNGDGTITPDEFYSYFSVNFGRLTNPDNLSNIKESLIGISEIGLTEVASEIASTNDFFDEETIVQSLIDYEMDERFGSNKSYIKETLELIWNHKAFFDNIFPSLGEGQNTTVQLDMIFDFLSRPQNVLNRSKRNGSSFTINLDSLFSAGIQNLKTLLIPTMEYATVTESDEVHIDSVTMAFNNINFEGSFPNGLSDIQAIFNRLSTEATSFPQVTVDQTIWVAPTPPEEGITLQVYGVDTLPVDSFTVIIPEFEIYQNCKGHEINLGELPEAEFPVIIWGVSQGSAQIDSHTYTKEFLWQSTVDFSLNGSGELGKVIEIQARDINKNVQFAINNKNGVKISESEKVSMVLNTKSNLIDNYNFGWGEIMTYPFSNFYPSKEWIKMEVDAITLIDAQIQNSFFQIYCDQEFDVSSSDTTINIQLVNSGRIEVNTTGISNKDLEKIYFLRIDPWYMGGELGFEFSDQKNFDLTGNRYYRAYYWFLKQNNLNEYYHYGLAYSNQEDKRQSNFYLEQGDVFTMNFTEDVWHLYTGDVLDKATYKIGEIINGNLLIKDGNNNTVYQIEKYNKLAQGNIQRKLFYDGSFESAMDKARNFDWNDYQYSNTVNPVIEIQNTQGITVKTSNDSFFDWKIPSHLKPGDYTVLFRWDTGPIAGVLQKTQEISLVEGTPDFHVLPELWNDLNDNNINDSALIFRVNIYDEEEWENYDQVFVKGPNMDTEDHQYDPQKGFELQRFDWGPEKGFRGFMWIWDGWPTKNQKYTVSFYKDGSVVKTIDDTIDHLFSSLPNITKPENKKDYAQPQNIEVTWASLTGASRYSVWIDKVIDAYSTQRVYDTQTENRSVIVPRECFENDSMYEITVTAYKTDVEELGDSRAAKTISIKIGDFDEYTLELTRELWSIDMNKGFDIRINFFNITLAEKVEHIWVSGPGIIGGQFDLVYRDNDDSPTHFSTFYGIDDDDTVTDDVYRITIEYDDGNTEVKDILICDLERNYPNMTSPSENDTFGNNQDILVQWNDSEGSQERATIEEIWFDVFVSKIANGYHYAFGQRVDVNNTGNYSSIVPQEYLEGDNRFNISVQKNVKYKESPYYRKKLVKAVSVSVGNPKPYEARVFLEFSTDHNPAYALRPEVHLKDFVTDNPIDRVDFGFSGATQVTLDFHSDWGDSIGVYSSTFDVDYNQLNNSNELTFTIYYKNSSTSNETILLSTIPQNTPTVSSPEEQKYSISEGENIQAQWTMADTPDEFRLHLSKEVNPNQWQGIGFVGNAVSPINLGSYISENGEGHYQLRIEGIYFGDQFEAISYKDVFFTVGNPPIFDGTLFVQNNTLNSNDEDDYFNFHYSLNYFDIESANDVRTVTLSDSDGNMLNIQRDSEDSTSFNNGYNPERNPQGMTVDILFDYATHENSTQTYYIQAENVFGTHPSITMPTNGSTVSADENLVVEYTAVNGAQRYYTNLYYVDGDSAYWIENQDKEADGDQFFTYSSSSFDTFSEGIYQVEVVAHKWEDLTAAVSNRTPSNSTLVLSAIEFVNENGKWETVHFINGNPEKPIKIPINSLEKNLIKYIHKQDGSREELRGYQTIVTQSQSERRFIVGDNVLPFTVDSMIDFNIHENPRYHVNLSFISQEIMNSITEAYLEGPAINGQLDFWLSVEDLCGNVSFDVPTDTLVPGDEYTIIIQTNEGVGYTATQTVPDYPRNSQSINWQTNIVDHQLAEGTNLAIDWTMLENMNYANINIRKVLENGQEEYIFGKDYYDVISANISSVILDEGMYFVDFRQTMTDENGKDKVHVFDDAYPFIVGQAKEFVFSAELTNLGLQYSDRWHTNFEVQLYGIDLDDIQNVTFDGECFDNPIIYRWTDSRANRLGAHYSSAEEGFDATYTFVEGMEFTATIYAEPDTTLARWFEMRNNTFNKNDERGAQRDTLYATASVLIHTVPATMDIQQPEDEHIYEEATDVTLAWVPIVNADGYWVRVEKYVYDDGKDLTEIWSTFVDADTSEITIPSQVFDLNHAYRLHVQSRHPWQDNYNHSSEGIIGIRFGDPIITSSHLEYVYEAEGVVGQSTITNKFFVMEVVFFDDQTYNEVKDSLYFDSIYNDEPESSSSMSDTTQAEYNDQNYVLTITKQLPLDTNVQEGDWAKVYGTAPEGATFQAKNYLHQIASLPTLTGISTITNDSSETIGWNISWEKGNGYCNNQYMEVYKGQDLIFEDGDGIGSDTLCFDFTPESTLTSGVYDFILYTNADGYSVLNFEKVMQ